MGRRKGDFSQKVIETLIKEVNGHCAAPGCDKYTLAGKAGDPGKAYTIGRAAHICAASVGGPRHDANMTDAERKSSANGIWLCGPHADEIDADKEHYTASELRKWKQQAIEQARSRLHTRPYREQDAIDLIRQLLRINGHVATPLSGAVHDLIHLEDQAMQALDPRFTVQSDIIKGQRIVHVSAVDEPVDVNFTIAESHVSDFWEQHQRLEDHGVPMVLPTNAFRAENSPLFAELFSTPGGTFSVGPNTRNAINTFELHHPTSSEVKHFEPFIGTVQYGLQSATFTGAACGGLFVFSYQFHCGPPMTFPRVNLAVRLELWEGRSIAHLPYLEAALEIFRLIAAGWRLHSALMFEGKKAFSGEMAFNAQQTDFFESNQCFLEYTLLCQQVAKRFDAHLQYTGTVTYTLRQLDEMRSVLRLFDGEKLECGLHNAPDMVEHLVPMDATVVEQSPLEDVKPDPVIITRHGASLTLFGTQVPLPDYYLELTSVRVRYSAVPEGEGLMRVRVQFNRATDCRCFAYYERRHWPPQLVPEGGFAEDAS